MKRLGLIVALVSAVACGPANTHTTLVVVVDSDLSVGSELDAVNIVGADGEVVFPFALGEGAGKVHLPVRGAFVPGAQTNRMFNVEARGSRQGSTVVVQTASVAFVPGTSQQLTLFLARSCRDLPACPAGTTCQAGACVGTGEAGTRAPYDPHADAGATDVHPNDAGGAGGKIPTGTGGSAGSVGSGGSGGHNVGGSATGGAGGSIGNGGAIASGGAGAGLGGSPGSGGTAMGGNGAGGAVGSGGAAMGGKGGGGAPGTGGVATGGAAMAGKGGGGATGTGGVGMGGGGAGGGGASGTGGAGGATGTDPCMDLCSNPVVFTSLPAHFAEIGTNATCYETTVTLQGVICSNLGNRTLTINGAVPAPCTSKLPARRNGGYCFQLSAGDPPYTALDFY